MIRYRFGSVALRRLYDEVAEEQNFLCAICRQFPKSGRLAVDHDHKTDQIRGLLCRQCNTGLGHFRDNPALLDAAIIYLESNRSYGEMCSVSLEDK